MEEPLGDDQFVYDNPGQQEGQDVDCLQSTHR